MQPVFKTLLARQLVPNQPNEEYERAAAAAIERGEAGAPAAFWYRFAGVSTARAIRQLLVDEGTIVTCCLRVPGAGGSERCESAGEAGDAAEGRGRRWRGGQREEGPAERQAERERLMIEYVLVRQ